MPTAAAVKNPPGVRQHLLEIAGGVFAERGFEGATIKEITERAGINVASVNYYFRDKFSLYLEVLRSSMAARHSLLTAGGEGLPAEERLALYIAGFMKALVAEGQPGWYGRIMVRELAQPTAALPQVVEEIIRPNCQYLRSLVSEIAGNADDETMRLLTHSVLSQCAHWKISQPIYALLYPDLRMDAAQIERMARHIAAFSIAGIKAVTGAHPSPKRRPVKAGAKAKANSKRSRKR